jgi:hypothetical protein
VAGLLPVAAPPHATSGLVWIHFERARNAIDDHEF